MGHFLATDFLPDRLAAVLVKAQQRKLKCIGGRRASHSLAAFTTETSRRPFAAKLPFGWTKAFLSVLARRWKLAGWRPFAFAAVATTAGNKATVAFCVDRRLNENL